MPIPIIRQRERITTRTPHVHFDRGDGSGWSFDLDEAGKPIFGDQHDSAYQAKTSWESGDDPGAIHFALLCLGLVPSIQRYEYNEWVNTYTQPAIGLCPCGEEIRLEGDYGHGIDCECGRIYNGSGQELAPRSQWEDRWDEDSTQPYCVEFGYIGPGDEY